MSSPYPSARRPPPHVCLGGNKANPAPLSSACLRKQHFAPRPPSRSPGSRRQPPWWELSPWGAPVPRGTPRCWGAGMAPGGCWEGPGQGWEIGTECYQPIVSPAAGLSPPARQGRAIKGCPPALEAGGIRGGSRGGQHGAAALPWNLPSPLPPRPAHRSSLR